ADAGVGIMFAKVCKSVGLHASEHGFFAEGSVMTAPTACVIGWPVAHSRSPVIHRFWLKEMGIDGDYVAVAVEPERIKAFLEAFAEGPYVGGNVTVPHKEAAFAAVAERDAAADAIGAVNTLWTEGGK